MELSQNNKENLSLQKILEIFKEYQQDLIKLSSNMNSVLDFLLDYGDNKVIPRRDIDYEKMMSFLKVVEKVCHFKNLLNYLNSDNKRLIFEKLTHYLIVIDQEKQNFKFQAESKQLLTADEIIASINSSIVKLLDINNPNHLYENLFFLLEKTRKSLIEEQNEEFFMKFKNCIVKLIFKLTKNLAKIYVNLEIKGFLSLLNKYFVMYNRQTDQFYMKTMKTVINEVARVFGNSLYDYYEFMDMDQEFLFCMNRFMDREKGLHESQIREGEACK